MAFLLSLIAFPIVVLYLYKGEFQIGVAVLLSVWTAMAIEDEAESEVYNYYHLIAYAILAGMTVLGVVNAGSFTYLREKATIDLIFPVFFLFLMRRVFKNALGKADVYFIIGQMWLFSLLSIRTECLLISLLVAYLIHGARYFSYMKGGKLSEAKPFLFSLVISAELFLLLS